MITLLNKKLIKLLKWDIDQQARIQNKYKLKKGNVSLIITTNDIK